MGKVMISENVLMGGDFKFHVGSDMSDFGEVQGLGE